MIRMSKMADYGTVVMTSLAREPDRFQSAAEVAARIGLSAATVSKILKTLAGRDLVESLRGARGGFRLRRSPSRISVAQVIVAIDGPIGMTECSTTPGLCSQEGDCTIRANWQRINRVIRQALEEVTLEQMTQPIAQAVVFRSMNRARPGAPA
jgi:FeS assembly SUF system regulator